MDINDKIEVIHLKKEACLAAIDAKFAAANAKSDAKHAGVLLAITMIKVSLDEYSDGWACAIETGPTIRGLPSVGAALDGAVKWIEAYDRVELITIDRIVTIARNGELWECDRDGTYLDVTSPGIAMVAAIEREWLGRDDHYAVRLG